MVAAAMHPAAKGGFLVFKIFIQFSARMRSHYDFPSSE
jgi:hypothetical protein